MADSIVVNSKVREAVKQAGKNMSGELSEALDKKVRLLINDAVSRANENGRATVMAKDL